MPEGLKVSKQEYLDNIAEKDTAKAAKYASAWDKPISPA